ncbi:MAG TPA: hypothetical protein VEU33_38365, partial [Archangium sp.]|nr:hypothetical protein [Archangium sp.]
MTGGAVGVGTSGFADGASTPSARAGRGVRFGGVDATFAGEGAGVDEGLESGVTAGGIGLGDTGGTSTLGASA